MTRPADAVHPETKLSRLCGSSFPAHAMPAADLARGALELVAEGSPAAVALAELVRRIDAGEIKERCPCGAAVIHWVHATRCRRR